MLAAGLYHQMFSLLVSPCFYIFTYLFYTCTHIPRTFIHIRISQFSKWSCSWLQTKIKHCRINNLSFGILKHFHVYCVWFSLDLDWNVVRLSHKHYCCTYWNLTKNKNQMEAEITGREINAEAADWGKIQSKNKGHKIQNKGEEHELTTQRKTLKARNKSNWIPFWFVKIFSF